MIVYEKCQCVSLSQSLTSFQFRKDKEEDRPCREKTSQVTRDILRKGKIATAMILSASLPHK